MSLLHQIALTQLQGVGYKVGQRLVDIFGSAQAVFEASHSQWRTLPRGYDRIYSQLKTGLALSRAQEELCFVNSHNIEVLWYQSESYPIRLRHCEDAPLVLYRKGQTNLNQTRMIAVVGTRRHTDYGNLCCRHLLEELVSDGVIIVSGLAYGIDTLAHEGALNLGLPTVGVLGHGLDRIYPNQNRRLALQMLDQGGALVSEFMSKTKPDAINFPRRNRIVAGLCDAIVVVEAAREGGALITADIANSYNRDVFAFPGRIGDPYSAGCLHLIKSNQAVLIEGAQDLRYILGWERPVSKVSSCQRSFFPDLNSEQRRILELLMGRGDIALSELLSETSMPLSDLATALMDMELLGLVESKPGDRYRLLN